MSARRSYVKIDAHVSLVDRDRLRVLARGDESLSSFVRGCIDDYLDAIGEPALAPIRPRYHPPTRLPAATVAMPVRERWTT